jgi:hypothetical protein
MYLQALGSFDTGSKGFRLFIGQAIRHSLRVLPEALKQVAKFIHAFEYASIRSCSTEEYENIERIENNFGLTHEERSRCGRDKI